MRAGKNRVCALAGFLVILTGLLTGCGQLQIEDRAFPTALLIAPAQKNGMYEFSFFFEEMDTEGSSLYHKEDAVVTAAGYPQAFTLFGCTQAAGLDDSHMQVILLSEQLLDDVPFLESFYGCFQKEHHFSWNTMVYLTDEHSIAPEDLKESTGGRTGTYLRDMAQSDEQEKTASVPTLGDLYKEWNNREKILLLPVLADSRLPAVDHYRMLVRGEQGETLSVDEARLLQLLRGELKKMQLELTNGVVVGLENVRIRRTYVPAYDIRQVTLQAECKVENRVRLSETEREKIASESERVLWEQLQGVAQWAPVKDAQGELVLPEYQMNFTWME